MKPRRDAILADALFVMVTIGAAIFFRMYSYGEFGSLVLMIGMCAIFFVTAFWMPLRLTPLLVWLADCPRREELSLTSIDARRFLWSRIQPPLFRLVGLVYVCTLLVAELRRPHEMAELIGVPLVTIILGTLAMEISLCGTCILFRWFCRSPKHLTYAWFMSLLIVIVSAGVLAFYMYLPFLLRPFTHSDDTLLLFGLVGPVLFFILLAILWRACWKKYFVFE